MDQKPFGVAAWLCDKARKSKIRWAQQGTGCRLCIKVALLNILLLVAVLTVYLIVVPAVTTRMISQFVELRNESLALSLWQRQPLPLVTRLYLWNLTNGREVATGQERPVFKEIGPYIFDQFKEKIPAEFKKDSIIYFGRSNYVFRADLSAPATLDDTVVTLHSGIYGIAMALEWLAPTFLDDALPFLVPGMDFIFPSLRVGSYLFEGLLLNCSVKETTPASIICENLSKLAHPNFYAKEDSFDYLYSFFAHKNYSLQGPYEESRGMTNILQLGKLLQYRNQMTQGVWKKGSHCDTVQGTDGSIIAPFIHKTDHLDLFIPDICQALSIFYEKEDFIQGLLVYKFSLTKKFLYSVENNPENKCFCNKNSKFCHYNGVRDISACMKAKVIISQPHFLWADEHFRIYAQGMNPHLDHHNSELYIEPQTGIPIKAAKRIQFNMALKRIKGFNLVENVFEGLFPLLWYEESILLTESIVKLVKKPLMVQWWVNRSCLLLIVATSVSICCSLVALLYLRRVGCFGFT